VTANFRVGLTRDFLSADGTPTFGDIGLGLLDRAGIPWEYLPEKTRELRPDQIRDFDALMLLGPLVTAATLEGAERLTLIARFGVGYDNIDVAACSRNGVLLTITPDGVRRPVAAAAMTFLLALSHKVLIKDRLTRTGQWAQKLNHMGMGVTGRTLGIVGFGNIGREIARLAEPFGIRRIASDPAATAADAEKCGVELMNLDDLLKTADYVVIACALTSATRHLINSEKLALMKPTAYLINVARGPIVDQRALTEALRNNQIQGAGLDVFEQEPVDPNDPILTLDNVIVAPHGLCWTDECFLGNGTSACQSICAIAAGRLPGNIVNCDLVESPLLQSKLRRLAARIGKR
jgi:phosphoglycerate dehydrogenase-like enzyme